MSILNYTTINGNTEGRASHFFRNAKPAEERCNDQNLRAERLGIKTRYSVAKCNDRGIDPKNIRD